MIQWGIIGAGNIAKRFIKGLSYSQKGELYAVASRTPEKRKEFKDLYPHIQIYESYEELLDDDNIDAVYIATWHNTHYQWAKEALKHHKAVLCEKPATLTSTQTSELCEIARVNQTFFMEAMKTRFIPLIDDIKKLIDEKVIGDLIRVENRFCYDISGADQTRYLFDEVQGGILNDVGSYNLASVIDYIHSPVHSLSSIVTYDRGVDVHDCVEIKFESGQTAYIEMAMNENKTPLTTIIGTKGKIEAMPFYRPESAKLIIGNDEQIISHPYENDDFFGEIEEVHDCIKASQIESQRMSFQDSIDIITLTEKIRESFGGKENEI